VMPLPISVAAFKKEFLDVSESPSGVNDADSANATLGVALSNGLLGQAGDVSLVSATDLVIATSSRVPAERAMLGLPGVQVLGPVPTLGILPSAIAKLDSSEHGVVVEVKAANTIYKDVSDQFAAKTLATGFPPALWGTQAGNNAPPIMAVSGMELSPKDPPKSLNVVTTTVGKLDYDDSSKSGLISFKSLPSAPSKPVYPEADLLALGLDLANLVRVPPPNGAPTIALGIG